METSEEYQVDLHWKEDQNAEASSLLFDDKIQITENWCLSHSKKDTWTAEHLFIASILGSYMTAYLRTAKNKGIDYKSFKSIGIATKKWRLFTLLIFHFAGVIIPFRLVFCIQ